MAVDYEAEFLSEQNYEGEFVAAAIKPEIVGKAVPSYEKQVLHPDPGCVFGSMEIEAIPEPTEQMDIFTNGEYHVERIGIVKVQVPQGVFPSGTLPVGTNGLYNVSEYEYADVSVPVEWVSPAGGLRMVRKEIVFQEHYEAQGTQFIPYCVNLANGAGQNIIFTTLALKAPGSDNRINNEIMDMVFGYTTGFRYRRTYWNGSAWVSAATLNTYFAAAVQAGSVYELIGFEF